MSNLTRAMMMGAAGAAGGATYVDDVFSTYLYDGTGSAQTITNGIDISGEGGLVWIKNRESGTQDNVLNDTERGAGQIIESNNTNAQFLSTARFSAFNSNGFTVGTDNATNQSGNGIVSWTFRKAPGFFDVVTYTGDGVSGKSISHSLESVPGFIIIKNQDETNSWNCWHRGVTSPNSSWWQNYLTLNTTNAAGSWTTGLTAEPTSTSFTVGTGGGVNNSGVNYVAYIFAHDESSFGTDGDESIIKCGTFEGNVGTVVNLGFEPQWILVKRVDGARDWFIYDTMRGLPGSDNANTLSLSPNLSAAENDARSIHITSTGFKVSTSTGLNSDTHIYMAIRRPNKPPEVATEVFKATNLVAGPVSLGFVPDLNLSKYTAGVQSWFWLDRLRGGSANLYSDSTAAEGGGVGINFDETTNSISGQGYGTLYANWAFKRAPGFFDVVAYTGTGANQAVNHNLGVTPEFLIIKDRNGSSTNDWICTHKDLTNTDPYIFLNSSAAEGPYGLTWNTPSSTALNISAVNYINVASNNYIAYLFATLPDVSKVGSYTGTGSTLNVDCGFSAGARFVLIKRTDSTGDWYVWDTARGIVSGNDPYLLLNSTAAEVTSTDYIDPYASGFTVSTALAALNASGGTYIFLAIA